MSGEPPPKRHKKHKRDRDRERYDDSSRFGGSTPTYSTGGPSAGNARLKLILKVGGSSTPEHSDSPGPAHILSVPYDEDSRNSSLYSHSKKSKKKEKKKKKDKKHKHHHKEKKRKVKDEFLNEASMGASPSPLVPPLTVGNMGKGLGFEIMETITIGDGIGSGSPSATTTGATREARTCVVKQRTDKQPLQKLLEHLVRALEKKDAQQFFAWPVTDKIAPGYSTVITDPMDFSTMKSKVDGGEYSTYVEFVDDFKRMCSNAMTYNQVETVYYKAAKKLLQGGLKILDPEKIRHLVPLIPSIRMLTDEQFPFPLFPEPILHEMTSDLMNPSEEEIQEVICLDPTKSIHYMPPHPNDLPDPCGAFTEDLVTEEILIQARLAARQAAHRLTTRKPNSRLGFLRQQEDGSTSLAILTSGPGMALGAKEIPMSLGALTGKITHGTSHLIGSKEERKANRGPKQLSYGPFSSYAPSYDSTFAALTKDESELVEATYGDDTASQYAESIFEFAKGCDYTMRMVDDVLNTLTKGEHSRTIDLIEERKRIQEEEAQAKREEDEYAARLDEEWGYIEMGFTAPGATPETILVSEENSEQAHGVSNRRINFDSLKSLRELGIDTGFVDDLKEIINTSVSERLAETAELLGNLEKVQNDRLSFPIQSNAPYVQPPSEDEIHLADRISGNLIDLAKQALPGDLASTVALRKAMGIDVNAFAYRPPPKTTSPSTESRTTESTETATTGSVKGEERTNINNVSLPPPPKPQDFENVPMEMDNGVDSNVIQCSRSSVSVSTVQYEPGASTDVGGRD